VSLHVGIGTVSGQVPPDAARSVADVYDDILSLAQVSEEAGFDSFWVSSHHGAANAHLPSPLVMLAAVAARTRRITLGTAVVLGPFQQPLRFAEDCAVLDQLSRGRLVVGIGVGWRQEEFEAFGIPISERVSRTVDLVRVCRTAWGQDRFSYQGRTVSYENVAITPKPRGSVPLLLGGSVPGAIARAGRLADGFIGSPQKRLADVLAQVEMLDRAAHEADRDADALTIAFQVNCWVSSDGRVPDSVQCAMWQQFGNSIRWHTGASDSEPRALPPLDEAVIRGRIVAGTPAEIVEQIGPWVDALGRRDLHLLFRLHYPGISRDEAESAARLFGAEVIPALKQRVVAPTF